MPKKDTRTGKFSATFTTLDGNTMKTSGFLSPLNSWAASMFVCLASEKPKVLKATLDLLLALECGLPRNVADDIRARNGVLGVKLVDDFIAAGGVCK